MSPTMSRFLSFFFFGGPNICCPGIPRSLEHVTNNVSFFVFLLFWRPQYLLSAGGRPSGVVSLALLVATVIVISHGREVYLSRTMAWGWRMSSSCWLRSIIHRFRGFLTIRLIEGRHSEVYLPPSRLKVEPSPLPINASDALELGDHCIVFRISHDSAVFLA